MYQATKLFTAAAALAATSLLSACDGSVRREGPSAELLEVIRADTQGNRRWVLNQDSLSVYDHVSRRRLRRLELPDWMLAGPLHACAPDMVLDSSGAAIVSSNVVPVVWRIDPQRFEITRIALTLNADSDKDIGFTALSFAADGTLIAAGTTVGSMWRIDLGSATATKLASYPPATGICDPAALLSVAARN